MLATTLRRNWTNNDVHGKKSISGWCLALVAEAHRYTFHKQENLAKSPKYKSIVIILTKSNTVELLIIIFYYNGAHVYASMCTRKILLADNWHQKQAGKSFSTQLIISLKNTVCLCQLRSHEKLIHIIILRQSIDKENRFILTWKLTSINKTSRWQRGILAARKYYVNNFVRLNESCKGRVAYFKGQLPFPNSDDNKTGGNWWQELCTPLDCEPNLNYLWKLYS